MVTMRLLTAAVMMGGAMLMSPGLAAAEPDQPLFAFIYKPGPAWKAGRPMAEQDLRPHGAYMARLVREGRMVAAGGFVGADGGIAVIRATDAQEAGRLLDADPAISSGVFQAEMRHWAPRFGAAAGLAPPAKH